ncbi:MAG: carboxypeptidase regulatory-like domain-containing protein [Candidatus Zixiibacteriota bacterium]
MISIVRGNNLRHQSALTLVALALGGAIALTESSAQEEAESSAYTVIEVKDGGTVSGVVRFDTNYPKRKKIRVSKDNEVCGTIKRSERFLVSKDNKGLQNVLVTIEGISAGKAPSPVKSVTLQQSGCTYIPHFQAAEIGAGGIELKLLNDDGIFHNVHTYQNDSTLFNIPHLGFQKELVRSISDAGVVTVKCDVHEWMGANIALLKDQPYFAVTDGNGDFTITDVPSGAYTVKAWHEALGAMEKQVTVAAAETAIVDFVIKSKKKKSSKK